MAKQVEHLQREREREKEGREQYSFSHWNRECKCISVDVGCSRNAANPRATATQNSSITLLTIVLPAATDSDVALPSTLVIDRPVELREIHTQEEHTMPNQGS